MRTARDLAVTWHLRSIWREAAQGRSGAIERGKEEARGPSYSSYSLFGVEWLFRAVRSPLRPWS